METPPDAVDQLQRAPEEYVDRLAKSDIVTIQHLLPSLQQKARWPEQGDRTLIVIGTRGEVPYAQRTPKTPILNPVEPGTIVLGYELHRGAKAKEGDAISFMGRQREGVDAYEEARITP